VLVAQLLLVPAALVPPAVGGAVAVQEDIVALVVLVRSVQLHPARGQALLAPAALQAAVAVTMTALTETVGAAVVLVYLV
jgi:hypothetical protein